MTPVSVSEAARALGVAPATLYRWFSEGAPGLVRRGYRGRGSDRFTLIDVQAVATWRRAREAKSGQHVPPELLAVATSIPAMIANSALDEFKATEGPHKLALADALGGLALRLTEQLTTALREAGVPISAQPTPEALKYLNQLAALSQHVKRNARS